MVKRLGERVLATDATSLAEKSLIGGKAWSIAQMSALGLNLPRACVIIERGAASIVTGPVPPALLAAAHAAQETGQQE
jgi:pyruvate, orthophosphate dikinase